MRPALPCFHGLDARLGDVSPEPLRTKPRCAAVRLMTTGTRVIDRSIPNPRWNYLNPRHIIGQESPLRQSVCGSPESRVIKIVGNWGVRNFLAGSRKPAVGYLLQLGTIAEDASVDGCSRLPAMPSRMTRVAGNALTVVVQLLTPPHLGAYGTCLRSR